MVPEQFNFNVSLIFYAAASPVPLLRYTTLLLQPSYGTLQYFRREIYSALVDHFLHLQKLQMPDSSKENEGKSNGASLSSGVCPDYTKEEIVNLQAANRRKILGEHNYQCGSCETTFATKRNLLEHSKIEHPSRREISCPLCGISINDHHDLVIYANEAHAAGDRTFSVETISFNSRCAFQDWKYALEEEETTRFEPSLAHLIWKSAQIQKKKVTYCTAYMKPSLTSTVMGKMSELCKNADRDVFFNNYASLLCLLRQNREESMVQYFERNWSPRICEWAGYVRRTSTVNTSMAIERFHRRLKLEFIQTKLSMARNVRERRHRLAEQHKRHASAIKMYCDGHVTSDVESAGTWLVCERNHTYRVEQMPCDCDEILNNHCYNCNACGYGFKCTCLDDHTAGVSCIHVHVALVYSPQGLVTYSHMVEGEIVTATESDEEADTPAISGTEVRDSALITETLDTCKELVPAITAEMAAIRMKVIALLKEPDDDVCT
ncbi:unnamed protein product [Cylicocyclus nassatus]|uniref:C2H2-type domain-containing protein n=1 Tax=Cylicocyclus nassatus TaxID=53992 RepID=A0AA36GY18_CYLNA|nr:unnamed protein product [Cylicocyclus nassatus]